MGDQSLSEQDAPLRVAYVINTYPRPSQTFIRREIRALEAAGLIVTRFAMRRDEQEVTSQEDRSEQDRTEYILDQGPLRLAGALMGALVRHPAVVATAWRAGRRSGPGRGPLRHLIYLAEAAVMAARCRQLEVAHIHAHFGTNSADVARYAALLGGPGYSVTFHGPEEFDAPHSLLMGDKIAEARFAVAVSAFGRSQLSRWTAFRQWSKLHVVHCGIDASMFAAPAPMPDPPGKDQPLRLVSVGRFVEQKGQMVLIEALARCAAPVHLTLVGDGPLAPELRAAITRLGLESRISLPGWLDEAGVRQALAEAHVMVLPSFAEGLPVALMEAMASARPCIATYIAGIPELMVDGETGWLIPAGSVQDLAQAIQAAAATPGPRLDAMGQAGRARALDRHDIGPQASRLAQLFRSCVRM